MQNWHLRVVWRKPSVFSAKWKMLNDSDLGIKHESTLDKRSEGFRSEYRVKEHAEKGYCPYFENTDDPYFDFENTDRSVFSF